jgi:hypothetical protein
MPAPAAAQPLHLAKPLFLHQCDIALANKNISLEAAADSIGSDVTEEECHHSPGTYFHQLYVRAALLFCRFHLS